MKGDYSRDTFDSRKHYRRVLMQQGRVQLDADWNEQVANLLHYVQSLARDMIGPYGAAGDGPAFMIGADPNPPDKTKFTDFSIGQGRYYVDGILCELNEQRSYYRQPDYPLDPTSDNDKLPEPPFLVYLDVWERHITTVEDPHIHEVALGEADTAARTQVVCQVKVKSWQDLKLPFEPVKVTCENSGLVELVMTTLKSNLHPGHRGTLKVRAKNPEDADATDACIVSPEARYRGAENQLYRVEIHRKGKAGDPNGATFKWSRENGSVVFPISSTEGDTVTVEHLGRDDRFGLEVGDWVELIDDVTALRGEVSPLLKVTAIDPIELLVTLNGTPPAKVGRDKTRHPFLRRWDHRQGNAASWGATPVVESSTEWLDLEDGIQIQFPDAGSSYLSGQYWLITARTATGDVELRYRGDEAGEGDIEYPYGHHYSPLAIVQAWTPPDAVKPGSLTVTDLRHFIQPVAGCCPIVTVGCPPFATRTSSVPFSTLISNMNDDLKLKYAWTVVGGTLTTSPNGAGISVTPDSNTNVTEIVATVTIEGLPFGCPKTAKGTCLIVSQGLVS